MTNTPKNFALQLGALMMLYASITSLTALLFGVISAAFPDAADSYYAAENASYTIRFGIAMLVVVFPIYLYLTRKLNQIRRNEEGVYLTLTKWLIYISLLIGGSILAGDLVAVINGYLNGELTMRFFLKALVLALIIGHSFYYYLKDANGYWQKHERESIRFGMGATAIVIAALVLGFYHSETPSEVREARIDDNQIQDLQEMQYRIEEYARIENTLPQTIEELYSGLPMPTAPEDRNAYEYKKIDNTNYELCATFVQDSAASEYSRAVPITEKNYNWSHGEGEWCFERVVELKNAE